MGCRKGSTVDRRPPVVWVDGQPPEDPGDTYHAWGEIEDPDSPPALQDRYRLEACAKCGTQRRVRRGTPPHSSWPMAKRKTDGICFAHIEGFKEAKLPPGLAPHTGGE